MKGVLIVLFILAYMLFYYVVLPPLSLMYGPGYLYIMTAIIIAMILIPNWRNRLREELISKCIFIFGIVFAVCLIVGSEFFNSAQMHQQIGKIEEKSFQEDIIEIDTSQIPVVDYLLADRLADKKLGEELAMGSQMEVGNFYNKQQVNGKLVYVAPLEHRSFWKWFDNQEGTDGYIIVSATNPNDVKLVTNLNGKDLKLRYLPSAYFSDNLIRHIRASGFRTEGLAKEINFELDEQGNPYWIVTTYENTTVWQNPEANGVITCNAQTGEVNWYSIDKAPKWIDIIQPETFIEDQLRNYGEYVHGMFNWSDKDKLSTTGYITTIYNNGECFYCTGMSSVGKDDATVGFVMVNTRDKSAKMYRMVGATEKAATRSAEGKVQHMGYTATMPIPINVAGIPTYFCTLKDAEGLIKEYAMLKIEDYSIVENGATIMETKRAFLNAINNSGTPVNFGSGKTFGKEYTGIVTRIGSNVESGNTYYYMILDGNTEKIYLASYMTSEDLPLTKVGDKVHVSYVSEAGGAIHVVDFDNLKIGRSQR